MASGFLLSWPEHLADVISLCSVDHENKITVAVSGLNIILTIQVDSNRKKKLYNWTKSVFEASISVQSTRKTRHRDTII